MKLKKKSYDTARLRILPSEMWLAQAVTDYYVRNREFLRKAEPQREEQFFTYDYQHARISKSVIKAKEGREYRFWLTALSSGEIIGMITLSGVAMGAFCSAYISYQIDENEAGKGLMTEALREVVRIAFLEIGLHRLEANMVPRNIASIKVVEKLGFVNEGVSKKYLKLNGVWEDHTHMVLLNEECN